MLQRESIKRKEPNREHKKKRAQHEILKKNNYVLINLSCIFIHI